MISLIAAVAKNGVIGSKNELPWYIPEDLIHFKLVTSSHAVIMGRKTYESVLARLGKPLPNRKNIVVTRNKDLAMHPGVVVFNDIDSALKSCKNEEEAFVMGGAQIYEQTMDRAAKLYITEVHKDVEGDVRFPEIDKSHWKETSREDHDEYSFVTYEKNK